MKAPVPVLSKINFSHFLSAGAEQLHRVVICMLVLKFHARNSYKILKRLIGKI